MAQDMLKRQWEQLKERVRQRWSRFTDDDLTQIDGDREALMGKIQERYGRSREQAQSDLAQWLKTSGYGREGLPQAAMAPAGSMASFPSNTARTLPSASITNVTRLA